VTDIAPVVEQKPKKPTKPKSYTVVCISIYNNDLDELDVMVAKLKSFGVHGASRSWLIRKALKRLNLMALVNEEIAKR